MNGRSDVLDRNAPLRELAARQELVATRGQLRACGVLAQHVQSQLEARRWQQVAPDVLVLHNGPLHRATRRWTAVLSAPHDAALASWSALELWGLERWYRPEIHLVIARGQRWPRQPDVVVHESRRHTPDDVVTRRGLPVHRPARAAVDAAAWSRSARTAVGLLAAVVQQGIAGVPELHEALEVAGRVRHQRLMRLSLHDIAGGAQSHAEIDFARLCREAGLPEPVRQRRRRDIRGRSRFLDVEWLLPDGRRLVLEIDGMGHLDAERWYDDLMRTAEIPGLTDDVLIRLPAAAARTEPERVIAILARYLTPTDPRVSR